MRIKVFIVSLFFICSLLPVNSLAQNKVIVIPLVETKIDADGDGWPAKVDCDDSNPDVHPNGGWHQNSAGGEVGWDWNCSGEVEKRYPSFGEVGKYVGSQRCDGHQIISDDNVDCSDSISGLDIKICELKWNYLVLPSGKCEWINCGEWYDADLAVQKCR